MILMSVVFSLFVCIGLYVLGYYGGSVVLSKLTFRPKKYNKCIEASKRFIQNHDKISIVLARLIPFSRTYISLAAGVLKCEFYSYVICSSIGITIWNSVLVMLGFTIFDNLFLLKQICKDYKILILIFVNVSIILFLVRKILKKVR